MKDIVTISAVNFDPLWGDTDNNLKRILEHIEAAAGQGADFVIFPETALTGYDDDPETDKEKKMHRRKAQTVPGKASDAVCGLTRKYGIYVVFGMAERDGKDTSRVYNSAVVCGPDGLIGTYRKIHLPFSEQNWADRGTDPLVFETEWGPVGVGICYDFYAFPEIIRFSRAMGARLFINCTAIGTAESGGAGAYTGNVSIEYHAHSDDIFIATSNMYGRDVTTWFMGGSSIVGPAAQVPEVYYYAGCPFGEKGADQGTVVKATVDLSIVRKSFYNGVWTFPDWRPDLYKEWLEKILETDFWKK